MSMVYCTLKEIGLEPQLVTRLRRLDENCTLKEIGLEPQLRFV